jgi:hypothetical protein
MDQITLGRHGNNKKEFSLKMKNMGEYKSHESTCEQPN